MIIDYFKLIVMIILWSFSFVLVDLVILYISPISLALYRFIVASIVFIIIDIYQYFFREYDNELDLINKENELFRKKDWYLIVLSSFCGVSFFFLRNIQQ